MFYNYKDNVLSVSRLELDIKRTLESGQIFRFDALDNSRYVLYSKDSYVLLEQRDDESLIYPISKDDLAFWVLILTYHMMTLCMGSSKKMKS